MLSVACVDFRLILRLKAAIAAPVFCANNTAEGLETAAQTAAAFQLFNLSTSQLPRKVPRQTSSSTPATVAIYRGSQASDHVIPCLQRVDIISYSLVRLWSFSPVNLHGAVSQCHRKGPASLWTGSGCALQGSALFDVVLVRLDFKVLE